MDAGLFIQTFGELHFFLDKSIITFPTRKAELLLVFLALEKRPFGREYIANLLWEDRTQQQALSNLRTIITMLRKRLGDYLDFTRQTLSLDWSKQITIDVDQLDKAASESLISDAHILESFRGNFLQDVIVQDNNSFNLWIASRRDAYHQILTTVYLHHVERLQRAGEPAQARVYLDRMIALDPYNEAGCRLMMRLQAIEGQQAAALATYQRFATQIETAFGLEPENATQTLYHRIQLAGQQARHPLPLYLMPFIGREQELTELANLLADETCRLITLTGIGGVGKTRLATQLAENTQQLGQFLNGVLFISMEKIASFSGLLDRLAIELDLQSTDATSLESTILHHLAEREMLIILDYMDNLIDSNIRWFIGQLLTETVATKVFITARSRLDIRGEWHYPIRGLSDDAARQLFHLQATQVAPSLQILEDDLRHIDTICQAVSGMPLGIELAARWLGSVPLGDLARAIAEDITILQTDDCTLPERHQHITHIVEDTLGILADTDRAMLLDLAVFESGFTREAAEAIVGVDFGTLSRLSEKACLHTHPDGRFDLDAIIRGYLRAVPIQESVQRHHSHYYAVYLVEQISDGEIGRLAKEGANLARGFRSAIIQRDSETVSIYAERLWRYFEHQTQIDEAIARFTWACAAWPSDDPLNKPDTVVRAYLEVSLAHFQIQASRLDLAHTVAKTALERFQRCDHLRGIAWAQMEIGIIRLQKDEFAASRQALETSWWLYRRLGDKWGIVRCLAYLGDLEQLVGNSDAAEANYRALEKLELSS